MEWNVEILFYYLLFVYFLKFDPTKLNKLVYFLLQTLKLKDLMKYNKIYYIMFHFSKYYIHSIFFHLIHRQETLTLN